MSIFFERRLVADGLCCLTVSGLTRFFFRPVPALLLLVLGFGRFVSTTCVCVRRPGHSNNAQTARFNILSSHKSSAKPQSGCASLAGWLTSTLMHSFLPLVSITPIALGSWATIVRGHYGLVPLVYALRFRGQQCSAARPVFVPQACG